MDTTEAENLFRRQALRALAERPYARPVCYVPRPWYWAVSLLLVLAMTAFVFAVRAEYSRKERVRGWLVPAAGMTRVSHDGAVLVEEVVRSPGEAVERGDALLVVSREAWLEDGHSSADSILAELRSQLAAIDERARLLRQESAIEAEVDAARQRSIAADERAVGVRIEQQQQKVAAASDRLLRVEQAWKAGAASEFDVLGQQDAVLTAQQGLARLEQERRQLRRDRQALDERADRRPIQLKRRISELEAEQSRLRQQITAQRSTQRAVVRAPIAGRLASIDVRVGETVPARKLMATIVPESLELLAEAYVPSSAVGLLRPGQRVLLNYDAFPMQQFGTFSGRVREISELVLLPDEIPQAFGLRQAAFRVRIELSDETIAFDNVRAGLRPGMTLGAEIVVETNSLASWLLRPLRFRPA